MRVGRQGSFLFLVCCFIVDVAYGPLLAKSCNEATICLARSSLSLQINKYRVGSSSHSEAFPRNKRNSYTAVEMSCVVSLSSLTEGSKLFRELSPSTASESRDKHGQHMKENRRTQEPTNTYSRMMASVGIKGLQKLSVFSDGSGHNFKRKRQKRDKIPVRTLKAFFSVDRGRRSLSRLGLKRRRFSLGCPCGIVLSAAICCALFIVFSFEHCDRRRYFVCSYSKRFQKFC